MHACMCRRCVVFTKKRKHPRNALFITLLSRSLFHSFLPHLFAAAGDVYRSLREDETHCLGSLLLFVRLGLSGGCGRVQDDTGANPSIIALVAELPSIDYIHIVQGEPRPPSVALGNQSDK